MPGYYQVTTSGGQTYDLCGSRGNYYVFATGEVEELCAEPVWCRVCRNFREAETLRRWGGGTEELFPPGRMSPARCIYCGQSDFVDFSSEEIPCPFQPGTMRCEFVGMCSTSFNEWFFTTEGKRIPLDLKPTYWALKHDIVSELLAETPDPKTAHNNRLMLLVLSFQEAHRHGVVDEESLAELQAHFRHPNVADLCSRWLSLSATLHLGLHWDDISATIRP